MLLRKKDELHFSQKSKKPAKLNPTICINGDIKVEVAAQLAD
jgi:hypothetical protein